MKTVTLKAAGEGATRVRVGERLFAIDRPVENVPEAVVKQLQEMPGVQVSVSETRSKSASGDADESRRR